MPTPIKLLWPSKRRLSILIANPNQRLPVLEDMLEDIQHVIRVQARLFHDESCAALSFDDLIGEGNVKLAKIITAGWLERVPNRYEFFKFFKASVANLFRGLVHRHRFTFKRTGVKPPKKGEQADPEAMTAKQAVVSIDQSRLDDAPAQFADEYAGQDEGYSAVIADVEPLLTPLEKLVLNQLSSPNMEALLYAQLDAQRGQEGSVKRIKIKALHMAKGLGMPLELFNYVQYQLRIKVTRYMSQKEDVQYNAALRCLEESFEIQIPKSVDPMIVRRILTLAAREKLSRLTPEVETALRTCGAKVPDTVASSINCFGVLYSKADSICHSCGLRVACATEAASYGLGEIVISPALLGPKQMRIPVLAPRASGGDPVFACSRDEEIYTHLCEHFDKVPLKSTIYFRHRDGVGGTTVEGRTGVLIALDESGKFRFIKASDALCTELVKFNGSWVLADDASVSDALCLIDTHAKETYTAKA